jgi:hypothetical protein
MRKLLWIALAIVLPIVSVVYLIGRTQRTHTPEAEGGPGQAVRAHWRRGSRRFAALAAYQ